MSLKDIKDIHFEISPRKFKKYRATLPDGQKVDFGHTKYEHYKDRIPLGLWSHKDHLSRKRRELFRTRSSKIKTKDGRRAIDIKYSPAWFSYYFLW